MLLSNEWNLKFMPDLALGFGIPESWVTAEYLQVEHLPYEKRFPYFERLSAAERRSHWVRAPTLRPGKAAAEKDGNYLVVIKRGWGDNIEMVYCYINTPGNENWQCDRYPITHWMELPDMPEYE